MIHPTAVVDPRAEIGEGCEIGAFCVVGPNVRMGANCRLHSHVVVDGHTTMGRGNEIFPFTTIGLRTQDLKWKGGRTYTVIGDNNVFRESVTVHSATGDGEVTRIGSNNNILAYCHVAHNCELGNGIIMSNSTGLAGHVIIEDYAVFGGMTGVHQFCRIGRMSMVGGCSRINQDVCPFTLVNGNPPSAVGLNKVGIERRGLDAETQAALKEAYRVLFRGNLTLEAATARIAGILPGNTELQHLTEFIGKSERGICR
jgi:UDP-N-acetylglucosamine acyltransferase